MTNLLPSGVARALDAASPRERRLVVAAAVVVVLAVSYVVAWSPLTRDIERARDNLARDRATLAAMQRLDASSAAPASATPPAAVEPRAAVLAALDARGLRGAAAQVELREGRVSMVLGAVPLDALVGLVDDLQRTAGLRVVEARLLARVEPGSVRAEITLGR
jgi:type II secretory pathway component PulM